MHSGGFSSCLATLLLLFCAVAANAQLNDSPDGLRKIANTYYDWRNQQYPVASSDQGLHTWDDRLTDYSPAAVRMREKHINDLLAQLAAMHSANWAKDDRIDFILFRSQLEREAFFSRIMHPEETNPQVYTGECSNAIFSLIKKDYAPPSQRAMAAAARMKQMPALLQQARKNLAHPVQLYAKLAIDEARSMDPLFKQSLMTLATDLTPAQHEELVNARETALAALHSFADDLEKQAPTMVAWKPMGEANYNYLLKHIFLLPLNADQVATIGEAQLAQFRGLEAMLPDPSLADPDPARSKDVPKNQQEFLAAYESREAGMINFLKEKQIVTLPPYLGHFYIRQLPDAFKPTSPGGFMNPPGVYDKDPSGFYFIPTYSPTSKNFYIRAAIEEPRPILGHEGIPGHFLQLSIANHLHDEIRRQNDNTPFVEGWALYTEEMLLRQGLYGLDSPGHGQVLRLARYRAARIGVDVNLHTGKWTFEQAVKYFMEAGGLDREAAEGEAAGAASDPGQKISYMVGKWQIMRLLGKYRDMKGKDFRLGAFHDDLISHGSLPVSVIEWLMINDPSDLQQALQ